MTELRGQVAVVTGGARRLGKATALALAHAGCNVVVNYRSSQAEAAATLAEVQAAGVKGLCVQADAAQPGDVGRLLDTTLSAFGRVDVLVANAGTFRRTPIEGLSEADWDDMLDNNLRTAFLTAHRFGLRMRTDGGGCIVTLADVAGERPWIGYLPYCVAKAGVIALTRALAKELAPSVRVNAIAPGPMLFPEDFDDAARRREIDRTLLQREGRPEHIAEAVLGLIRNDYITGVILPVDGGRGLK